MPTPVGKNWQGAVPILGGRPQRASGANDFRGPAQRFGRKTSSAPAWSLPEEESYTMHPMARRMAVRFEHGLRPRRLFSEGILGRGAQPLRAC
jgi:hypothetical protein